MAVTEIGCGSANMLVWVCSGETWHVKSSETDKTAQKKIHFDTNKEQCIIKISYPDRHGNKNQKAHQEIEIYFEKNQN